MTDWKRIASGVWHKRFNGELATVVSQTNRHGRKVYKYSARIRGVEVWGHVGSVPRARRIVDRAIDAASW